MSKKKLVELLPKDSQHDNCLDTNYFQTEEGDQKTTKMVKLFDKYFVIFTVMLSFYIEFRQGRTMG